jgi:hypothetical protein
MHLNVWLTLMAIVTGPVVAWTNSADLQLPHRGAIFVSPR